MATLGTLEYLISIDSSRVSSGLSAAEGKVKGFGNKLSSWAVAKGQIIANLVSKAASSTMDFVAGAIEERKGFDKAMSQVAATMGKTVSEMNQEIGSTDTSFGHFEGTLSDFARYMGANTAFTAQQAAEALNYMALAGYDTQKSMDMLPKVLNLAAAGNMDLARASDMVTDAQSALGLTAGETEVLVDQMAKTSSRTNTSVEQLGDAILQIGGTAKNLKGGTKELNALLGVLADNGIKGAEGGTALRNVLQRLTAPTSKASKALKELGVDAFENGKLRELPDIFEDFNKATAKMSQQKRIDAFSKIFNVRDLKAVEALLGTAPERWEELYNEIANSQGAAGEMAETQLDNLDGDITKFGSALSEAKLTLVEGLTPALRNLVQRGTALVQRLTNAFKENGFKGVLNESKKAVLELAEEFANSENPIKRAIGKIALALSEGLSWDSLKEVASVAWDTVVEGAKTLGGVVFGKKEDGSVDWPEWSDVAAKAEEIWDGIKEGAKNIAKEAGKLIFGTTEDGEVALPDASELVGTITTWWDSVKPTLPIQFPNIDQLTEDLRGKLNGVIDWLNTWTGLNLQHVDEMAFTIDPTAKIEDDAELANKYISQLEQLTAMYGEGASYLPIWQQTVTNLTTLIPDLGKHFDDESKKIKTNTEELRNNVEEWKNLAKEKALANAMEAEQQKVADAYDKAARAALDYNEAAKKLQENEAQLVDLNKRIVESDIGKSLGLDKLFGLDGSESPAQAAEKTKQAYSELFNAGLNYKQVMSAMGKTEDDWADVDMAINGWSNLSDQVKAAQTALDEANKQAELAEARYKSYSETMSAMMASAESSTASAKSEVTELTNKLDALDGRVVTVHLNTNGVTALPKAKGDWNVPYDNYIAALHRGEMVLTATQARKYREGKGTNADLSALIPAIADAIHNGMQGTSVNSYLNGNKVSSETNRATGSILSARRFAPA